MTVYNDIRGKLLRLRRTTTVLFTTVIATGIATPAIADAPTITQLPSTDGAYISIAYDVSQAGSATGTAFVEGAIDVAVKWSANNTLTVLPGLAGSNNNWGLGINSAGQVAGRSNGVAVRWSASGTVTALAQLPGTGFFSSWANDINENGQVVGDSHYLTPDYEVRAVRWVSPTQVVELPRLAGTATATAAAVNNNNVVVGSSGYQAVRWDANGNVTALSTPAGTTEAVATGINDKGESTGYVVTPAFPYGQPIKWSASGAYTLLTPPHNNAGSRGEDINADGVVVGHVLRSDNRLTRAVRWNTDGTVTELDILPTSTESTAKSINNAGHIVGESYSEPYVAVRWTP